MNKDQVQTLTRDEFTHDDQPYGTKVLGNAVWTPIVATDDSPDFVKNCAKRGLGEVTGIVVKGGSRAKLFQHRVFVDKTGQPWSVWAVSREEFERGTKTTVAM